MKQYLNRILTLVIYHFSPDKRELDRYIKRIRRLEALTDTDWERLRTLAQREIDLKDKKFHELIKKEDNEVNTGMFFKVL